VNSKERIQSLSGISTLWTVVSRAHEGSSNAVQVAQGELLQRYSPAIHRYLLGALHDAEAADELSQEFALRFIRGDFVCANPELGRFRDYVKGVLSHLIADHFRRRKRSRNLPNSVPEPAAPDPCTDKEFVNSWRDELMQHTWDALGELQTRTGKPFHTVLRSRTDCPKLTSGQRAEQLSARLGYKVTDVWVRQTLHRAREKFVDLLMQAVSETMSNPTVDELEAELSELGLWQYCKAALNKMRGEN